MVTKRPNLHALPTTEQRRSRQVPREEVRAIVRRHLEEACDRAWAELAEQCERPALLAAFDPAAAPARAASRELVGLVTDGLTRLAIAAITPAARRRAPRGPWNGEPPRLSAIDGGLRPDAPAARD